jgi:hypothetical protein
MEHQDGLTVYTLQLLPLASVAPSSVSEQVAGVGDGVGIGVALATWQSALQ